MDQQALASCSSELHSLTAEQKAKCLGRALYYGDEEASLRFLHASADCPLVNSDQPQDGKQDCVDFAIRSPGLQGEVLSMLLRRGEPVTIQSLQSTMGGWDAPSQQNLRLFKLLLQYVTNPIVMQQAEDGIKYYRSSLERAGLYHQYKTALQNATAPKWKRPLFVHALVAHTSAAARAVAPGEGAGHKRRQPHPDRAGAKAASKSHPPDRAGAKAASASGPQIPPRTLPRHAIIKIRYDGIRGPRADHRYEGTSEEYGEEEADAAYNTERSECCRSTERELKKILKSLSDVDIDASMGEKGHMYASIRVPISEREDALSVLRGHDLVELDD